MGEGLTKPCLPWAGRAATALLLSGEAPKIPAGPSLQRVSMVPASQDIAVTTRKLSPRSRNPLRITGRVTGRGSWVGSTRRHGSLGPPSAGPWTAQLDSRARASRGLPGAQPCEAWLVTAAFASSSPGVGLALDAREAASLLPGGLPFGGVWAGARALGRGF